MDRPNWDSLKRHWKWLVGAAWLLSGALYLTLPPSPDQSEYNYMGWRIVEGDAPYRDFVDMNWPGLLWLNALATALFGNRLWSWRLLDFALLAMSGGFLADLVRRAAGRTAAFFALILYPVYYAAQSYLVSAQSDATATHFLLGALWFHVRAYEAKDWRWQAGTGAFLALAALGKPTAALMGVVLVGQALLLREAPLKVLIHSAVAATCSTVLLGVAFLAVLAQGASVERVRECLYTYNAGAQFFDATPVGIIVRQFLFIHARWWNGFTAAALLGAGWGLLRTNRSLATTSLAALWVTGTMTFALQRKGYDYHLAVCLPALIGLSATAIGVCWARRAADLKAGSHRRAWLAPALTGLLLLAAAGKLGLLYSSVPGALLRGDWTGHWSRFTGGDGLTTAESIAMAHQLDEELPPGEPLFVLGRNSLMNYLARRRQPTKFCTVYPLLKMKPPLPMADRWSSEWEAELRQITTRKFLIAKDIQPILLESAIRPAVALRSFLEGYRKTGTLGGPHGIDIYERR